MHSAEQRDQRACTGLARGAWGAPGYWGCGLARHLQQTKQTSEKQQRQGRGGWPGAERNCEGKEGGHRVRNQAQSSGGGGGGEDAECSTVRTRGGNSDCQMPVWKKYRSNPGAASRSLAGFTADDSSGAQD